MKRFITKLSIFVFIYLAVSFIVYAFWLKPRLYNGYYKDSLFDRSHQTVILADSHGTSLNNVLLSNHGYINFSSGGDSYIDMLSKANYLIRNGRIRRVIITVDDHTLSPYREKINNLSRSLWYSNATIAREYYNIGSLQYLWEKYFVQYFPTISAKYSGYLKKSFLGIAKRLVNNVPEDSVPFHELDISEQRKESEGRMRTQFPGGAPSELLVTALNEIITLCLENNIELLGIKYPLHSSYVAAIEGKSYGADSILKKREITVIDYMNYYHDKNELFFNQDHLNTIGGTVFTQLLLDNIQEIKSSNNLIGYID